MLIKKNCVFVSMYIFQPLLSQYISNLLLIFDLTNIIVLISIEKKTITKKIGY